MTEYRPVTAPGSRLADRFLLFGLGLAVCIVGVTFGVLANTYAIDQKWVLFTFMCIGFIPIVWRRCKNHSPKTSVIAFFATWMILHGVLGTFVAKTVPLIYWLPIYFFEFMVGNGIAGALFDRVQPKP